MTFPVVFTDVRMPKGYMTFPVVFTDLCVPKGYMTFPDVGSGAASTDEISFRDVTSPINPDDYTVHCPTSNGLDFIFFCPKNSVMFNINI